MVECWWVPIAVPVNVSAGTVPCVPVKVSADVTLEDPAKAGTPAGHATVPPGTPVIACVAVVTTLPVEDPCLVATTVCAVTARVLTEPL